MNTPRARSPRSLSLISHVVVGLGLVVLTVLRARDAAMSRPFEVDELLTVRYYTWLCVTDGGEVRQIDHIDDYHRTPRPTVRNVLMGIYCSAGRWPEANNHILNSALVGTSLIWERTERAARLPALLGLGVFAFALYWLCGPVLGWRFAAPLVALWVWFCPFLIGYAFRARGYSWMLALQVLFVLAMVWSARKPSSVARGAVCATLAIISFLNVVNMAVDWVLPVYLSLYFLPPTDPVAAIGNEGTTWRRNLVVQMLAVGAVGLTFLTGHLPSVYSVSEQAGLRFDSLSGVVDVLSGAFDYLLAGLPWKIFGMLSVAGLLLLFLSARARWMSALVVFTLTIELLHALIAHRLPYERGLSYVFPFAMLGTAYLVECAVRWPTQVSARIAVGTLCAGLSVLLATSASGVSLSNERLNRSLELAQQLEPSSGIPTLMLADQGLDYLAAMYRPRGWQYVNRPSPETRLQIVAFLPYDATNGFNLEVRGGPLGMAYWKAERWQFRSYPANQFMSMLQILGETRAFPSAGVPGGRALIFWYPDVSRLGVRGDEQLRIAAKSGLRYIARGTRYAAKLDIFANLESIVFITESPDEYQRATSTVSAAIERLGGTALVFMPH